MFELKPVVFHLSNGLRVVYLHAPAYVAHLGVTVLAGSRFEHPGEEGLAHFLEHCIFKGTKKRRAYHVLSRLDSVGGELNAYTAKEEMCLYASFTKNHLRRTSELLSDIILNSTFPPREIAKEKEIVIDEINSYLDSPGDKIFDDFEELLFKGHALGNNILGTRESVNSFTQKDLERYVSRFFRADKMVISFVGDIPLKQVQKVLEHDFGNCTASGEAEEHPDFRPVDQFLVRSKEANYQAHSVLGGMAPGYLDEHRRGMTLLTNVLGGPALNSRLILSIREKHGLAYNIEANYTPYVDIGYWTIYFGTDQRYLEKSRKLVYRELRNLRENKLGSLQLSVAKEQLKGQIALGLDSNSGLMLGLGKSLLLFNQIDTVEEIYDAVDRISASELLEIANRYFAEDQVSELIFETGTV